MFTIIRNQKNMFTLMTSIIKNHGRHNEGTCPIISMNLYLLSNLWKTKKSLSLSHNKHNNNHVRHNGLASFDALKTDKKKHCYFPVAIIITIMLDKRGSHLCDALKTVRVSVPTLVSKDQNVSSEYEGPHRFAIIALTHEELRIEVFVYQAGTH